MPLNGAGSYTPPAPEFPAISGTLIESAEFNAIIADIASALSLALYRDGQVPFSANQSMGNFRLTNVGAPVGGQDAINLTYLVNYVTSQIALGSVYLGSFTANPTERPDGTALQPGDIYLNISNPLMPYFRAFSGTVWVEGIPGDAATINYTPKGTGAVATTSEDILDAQLMVDYAALRAYTGLAKTVRITGLLVTAQPQGIAGFFQYDETDTTSADNGGTIIVDALGRRWKRNFDGPVFVGWFGVVFDGVTDSTAAVRLAAATGRPLRFGSGACRVSGTINPNTTDSRRFFGEETSDFGGSDSVIIFDDSGLSNTDKCIEGCVDIQNISIVGLFKNAIGISFNTKGSPAGTFGFYRAKNVRVDGCFKAFFFDSMFSSRFENLYASGNNHGFWIEPVDNGGDSGYLTDTIFENCSGAGNSGHCWFVNPPRKSPTVTFANCAFQGESSTVDYVSKFNSNLEPFIIQNGYLEGAGGTVGAMLIGGIGEVKGFYHNSPAILDTGTLTASIEISSLKCSTTSGGFGPGSSNTNHFSLVNSNSPNVLGTYRSGYFRNASIDGSNKDFNFQRITEGKAIVADGTANNLFSINIPSASFTNAAFFIPFTFEIVSGGIVRQMATGLITLNYLNFSGVAVAASSSITISGLTKGVASGTISDPTFTLVTNGTALEVRGAITSSIAGATGTFKFDVTQATMPSTRTPIINTL